MCIRDRDGNDRRGHGFRVRSIQIKSIPSLTFCLCMIFSGNRLPSPIGVEDKLFGIMHVRGSSGLYVRVGNRLKGTSNNCHQSSGAPNLPPNDSALFSFRFCAVHPKDVRDCQLRQLFEVPSSTFVPSPHVMTNSPEIFSPECSWPPL